MNSKDLNNFQQIYSNIYEAVGRDEMLAANIARAKASRPLSKSTPTSPTTTRPSTSPSTTPKPSGPVSQTPKPSGGLLGKVDSTLRDVAGRVGGEIGAQKGRGTLGNVLGVPERIGRNKGTQQGQQMYDKAKETIGGLLKQDYEFDNFDIILEYLVAEGYADTNQSALVIMANMSEEWRQTILEYSQMELGSLSQSINQNTRNAPIKKHQPGFQPSQSEPQRPSGVPIPGSSRVFNTVKKVGQATVGSVLK